MSAGLGRSPKLLRGDQHKESHPCIARTGRSTGLRSKVGSSHKTRGRMKFDQLTQIIARVIIHSPIPFTHPRDDESIDRWPVHAHSASRFAPQRSAQPVRPGNRLRRTAWERAPPRRRRAPPQCPRPRWPWNSAATRQMRPSVMSSPLPAPRGLSPARTGKLALTAARPPSRIIFHRSVPTCE